MTDTSDKAIEALVKYHDWKDSATEDEPSETSAMLIALQAERKAGWVARVKPLEWRETGENRFSAKNEDYKVVSDGVGWAFCPENWPPFAGYPYATFEDAKAAAQADYAARSIAALTPNTEAKP